MRLPAGQDPADVVQVLGAVAMRRLLDGAIPVPRFEVERALGRPDRRRRADAALAPRRGVDRPARPSVLRSELVKLVSDRLNVPSSWSRA